MHLGRDDIRTLGQSGSTGQAQPLKGISPLEPRALLDGEIDGNSTRLLRGSGLADNTRLGQAKAAATLNKGVKSTAFVPYIWCQSRDGGYYDASGTIKGVVPGARLKLYGGRFNDGSPIPTGNVAVNESGHVFWQPGLTHPYFFDK